MPLSRPFPILALVTAAVAATAGCGRARAQQPGAPRLPELDAPLVQRVDSLYHEGLHKESLTLLDNHLRAHPDDYRAQVLAGRAALALAIGASYSDTKEAKMWFHKAIAYGKRALAIEPLGEEGRYITMASEGRLALIEGGPTQARLGAVVDTAARSLLAEDSLNAGAHDALGRLYYEIRTLSWIKRITAKHWLGSKLMSRATWKAAEHELRRAVQLDPGRNRYYVDLGMLLVKRHRFDEARAVLEAGLKVPLHFPEEAHFRDDMRRLLAEIDGHGAKGASGPP